MLGQGSGQRGPSLDLTVVHIGSNAIALKIQHSQGEERFISSTDAIHLPSREQFKKAAGFYATALHELGHPDRLNRDLAHPFGSEGYAREELRAEIASLILGSELGLGYDPGQHAGYVDHWVQILADTPTENLIRGRSRGKNQ